MIVVKRTASTGYAQDPTKYFDFSRFIDRCGDLVLVEGAFEEAAQWEQFPFTGEELENLKKKKIVRLEFEEPNKFFLGDRMDLYDPDFYRIYTICPYTSEWLNSKNREKRRVPIFFPFNEEHIPQPREKKYDIIYTGHIVSPHLLRDLEMMKPFKYRFVSNSDHPLVTDHGAEYHKKMELIAESKITLVLNLLYPTRKHIRKIWEYPGWRDNLAFDLVPRPNRPWRLLTDRNVLIPHIKSRTFEAAFGRSLILCRRDPFNIIERFFTPEKEFIYYKEGKLQEKVREILADFRSYEPVIEAAFQRAVENYTTAKFVMNYLEKLD